MKYKNKKSWQKSKFDLSADAVIFQTQVVKFKARYFVSRCSFGTLHLNEVTDEINETFSFSV